MASWSNLATSQIAEIAMFCDILDLLSLFALNRYMLPIIRRNIPFIWHGWHECEWMKWRNLKHHLAISEKMRYWFGRWTQMELKKYSFILPPTAIYPSGRMLQEIIIPMQGGKIVFPCEAESNTALCCRPDVFNKSCPHPRHISWPPLTLRFVCDMLYVNGPIDITVKVVSKRTVDAATATVHSAGPEGPESPPLPDQSDCCDQDTSDCNHARDILSGMNQGSLIIDFAKDVTTFTDNSLFETIRKIKALRINQRSDLVPYCLIENQADTLEILSIGNPTNAIMWRLMRKTTSSSIDFVNLTMVQLLDIDGKCFSYEPYNHGELVVSRCLSVKLLLVAFTSRVSDIPNVNGYAFFAFSDLNRTFPLVENVTVVHSHYRAGWLEFPNMRQLSWYFGWNIPHALYNSAELTTLIRDLPSGCQQCNIIINNNEKTMKQCQTETYATILFGVTIVANQRRIKAQYEPFRLTASYCSLSDAELSGSHHAPATGKDQPHYTFRMIPTYEVSFVTSIVHSPSHSDVLVSSSGRDAHGSSSSRD